MRRRRLKVRRARAYAAIEAPADVWARLRELRRIASKRKAGVGRKAR